MKYLLVLLFLVSTSVSALEVKTAWNEKFQKEVILNCSEDNSYICQETCNSETECRYEEKTCRDCIGTTTIMTFIFREMGRSYRAVNGDVTWSYVFDTLAERKFVTLTSKSIYNQIERFDSPKLKAKFQALCPTKVEYPVAFFKTEEFSGKISTPDFVVCGSNVYQLELDPEIDVDSLLDPLALY